MRKILVCLVLMASPALAIDESCERIALLASSTHRNDEVAMVKVGRMTDHEMIMLAYILKQTKNGAGYMHVYAMCRRIETGNWPIQ